MKNSNLEQMIMSDELDDYKDVAIKNKVIGTGYLECSLPHSIDISVKLDGIDDIIQAIEQDSRLKKALYGKYEIIFSEEDITNSVKQLIEAFLSIFTESKENLETQQFILRTLNKI